MRAFWSELFRDGALNADRRIYLFSLPSRETRHFSTLEGAEAYASRKALAEDVYFGCALSKRGVDKRPAAGDAIALGGFWVDADIANIAKRTARLPASWEEAREFLFSNELPVRPTVVVGSGYGAQAWWLLDEPWIFSSAEDAEEAACTARGWVQLVCELALKHRGWVWDRGVHDLARVMRPPGTWNRKVQGDPKPVTILEADYSRRYPRDQFQFFAAPAAPAAVDAGLVAPGDVPFEKLTALLIAAPVFARTWERRRDDWADQSGSVYDQALADIAAIHGWSDEEIGGLIVAFRSKHGLDVEKGSRPDYLGRTVANARRVAQNRAEAEAIDVSAISGATSVVTSGVTSVVMGDPPSARELMAAHPAMRPAVIDGLLRSGETMNLIASSKAGKSWLVLGLALSVVTGRPWLDYQTVPGEVLIIDNELHPETIAARIPRVAEAIGLGRDRYADRLFIKAMRGQMKDLLAMAEWLKTIEPGRFRVIVLDAFYRFLPMRVDENDNGTMTQLYNALDRYAEMLKTSFVVVHHATKGVQAGKAVTDVGAGAGAQSRATDTHMTLRRHAMDNVMIVDAVTRSFQSPTPFCVEWTFPIWRRCDHDPKDYYTGKQ